MDSKISRRQFLKITGLTASVLALPRIVRGQVLQPRVVVVGGGFAGATVAKYLRMWSNNSIDVTLVAPDAAHTSCILSNFAVTGQVKLSSITFPYAAPSARYGFRFIQGLVSQIVPGDPTGQVVLSSGQVLDYDRLILAPGVSFDPVPGLEIDSARTDDKKLVPHAWIAGAQTTNLQKQLKAIPNKGTFIISVPLKPYRGGPGPYERACLVADYMKRNKGGGKVIVLDANPSITTEPNTFNYAFNTLYSGIVQYVPNAALTSVSFSTSGTTTKRVAHVSVNGSATDTKFSGNVLNVIPRNKAADLLFQPGLGLTNVSGRWAGVDPTTYESTAIPRIHILGDSQGTGLPKAGHLANSEAKVCADALVRIFGGSSPLTTPVTSMGIFSAVSKGSAGFLNSVYQYDPVSKAMTAVAASAGEAPAPTSGNYELLFGWAQNLLSDSFT